MDATFESSLRNVFGPYAANTALRLFSLYSENVAVWQRSGLSQEQISELTRLFVSQNSQDFQNEKVSLAFYSILKHVAPQYSQPNSSSNNSQPPPFSAHAPSSPITKKRSINWVLVGCISLCLCIFLSMGISSYYSSLSVPSSSSLTTYPHPESGTILSGTRLYRPIPLTVKTDGTGGHKIILAEDGKSVFSFYCRGGDTVTIMAPLGIYDVYDCYGQSWYGNVDLFGNETKCYKFSAPLEFDVDHSWELTLYDVYNGNATTDPVPASEIPS